MTVGRIIYSRGFPYGAPLLMIRGGATKDPVVKGLLREQGLRWNSASHAYETYLYGPEARVLLAALAGAGCEVLAKADLDPGYVLAGYEERA